MVLAAVLSAAIVVQPAFAQGGGSAATGDAPVYASPVRTDSPRDTLASFLRLAEEMEREILAYTRDNTFEGAARISLLSDQMISLIELETIAGTSQRERGIRTITYLMDIFGRIGAPDLLALPDTETADTVKEAGVRIPGTPLRIVQIHVGEREGEFLFSPSTEQAAARFFRAVRHLPLVSPLSIESFTYFGPQLTGPLVPAGVVASIPEPLRDLWLDTPIWKAATIVIALVAVLILIVMLQRFILSHASASRLPSLFSRAILPLAILAAAIFLLPALSHQLNLSGRFAAVVETIYTVAEYAASAWLFWLGIRMLFEWIIRAPNIQEDGLDANLLRLVAGVIGLVGSAVILAFGGQAIGLPILSVLAGLGIGGLAVALALRPTLENLVGGVILYIDRPVRVGDFCTFGDRMGTVEGIGIRSTKLRALDRTLISVPNAQFADMQIVNWAECDQMLIKERIGVRYETSEDQLRFLLVELRRMLHAHPRIDSDTVRVRFAGFGDSALSIDIRVYAQSREWNDFFAIREDVFFRIYQIVAKSGTGFAFPSQTFYLARDGGLDPELSEAAASTVEGWRRAGRLPFPRLSRDELDRLEGTLDYPPRGSPEAGGEELEGVEGAERLSDPGERAEPLSDPAEEPDRDADAARRRT